ncbi:hypothetical protein RDWZM_002368 [Blomia tropicalis]|uniref:Uncharacterized protein n=1 Tax=Blomia tropicalis TaxID=40697 RepID=A0A9Q0RPV1_BLOTA|nr:hypothetical protein RDWZM_002368 [Blomia tropicalis]
MIFIWYTLLTLGTSISLGQIRSFYQASQPQSLNSFQSGLNTLSPIATSIPASGSSINRNIFNDANRILYKPQTAVVYNDGQEKEGDCPVVRPASGYTSFKQYEGLWFKRYRSRVREGEPFFKCAWIDYIDQGTKDIFITDNLLNNVTNEWFRQNATTEVWSNDPTTWTSTMPNGARFDTHLIYYDGNQGLAVIYSCMKTANGHRGIGNIYTRSPKTPLSSSYVNFLLDIFYQNGIYDVLPLHFVNQDVCEGENLPFPRNQPKL